MIFVRCVTLRVKIWDLLLRDCPLACRVWEGSDVPCAMCHVPNVLEVPSPCLLFFWLKRLNLTTSLRPSTSLGIPWNVISCLLAGNIWTLSDKTLFHQEIDRTRDHLDFTLKFIIAQSTEWKHIAIPDLESRTRNSVFIKWCPPHGNCFKFNTAAVCKKDSHQAVALSVMQMAIGYLVFTYQCRLFQVWRQKCGLLEMVYNWLSTNNWYPFEWKWTQSK